MNRHNRVRNLIIFLFIALPVIFTPPQASQAQGPVFEEPAPPTQTDPAAIIQPAAPITLSRAFSGGAQYDSGWVNLAADESLTLNHNLGGSESAYVVDMQYRGGVADGINQRYYGGADFGASPSPGHAANDRAGAYWRSLTITSITVYRRPEDTYAEQIRIRIWVDAFHNYDSDWISLAADETRTLTHNIGGSADDYVVDMQYKSASSGINQRYFGGADFGTDIEIGSPNDRTGAYWRSLTNMNIVVYRRPEDTYASQVRIRIWLRPAPTYDSGWVSINTDTAIPLNHNIGGQADDYLVNMQFRSADANGINNRAYGGMDVGANPSPGLVENDRVGAYWRSLTASAITIYRRPEDIYAPQVRIRIFRFWSPPAPNYDSGWQSITSDHSLLLAHNLGGDVNTYMVDTQFRGSSEDGINLRYYGGADFGDSINIGSPNDRVGAYWRTLTSTSIIVYRRPEDPYVQQIRIRIWKMPKPDYDSGWLTKAPGTTTTLTHNLYGNYQDDYLVYFDQRSTESGINQRYYGGADFGALAFEGASNNARTGAYWHRLNDKTVAIYRQPEDTYAEELRLRVWRVRLPDYHSGWVALNKNQASQLAHYLGGSQDFYFMQMVQYDTSNDNYLNHRHFGGADFGSNPAAGYFENDRVGAYWRSLTPQGLIVYRRPEDGFADYVMVRIWNYNQLLYLPTLLN